MKSLLQTGVVLVLAGLLLGLTPTHGTASPPRQIIQGAIDDSLRLLRSEDLQKPESLPRLREKLTDRLKPLFDFREMTLRALGRHGREFDEEQINRLTGVFSQLLERVYTDRLTDHLRNSSGSTGVEDIRITGEQQEGKYSRVESVVVLRKKDQTASIGLNYKMVQRDDEWRIYDLEIEDVSLIGNYRSQFNEILTNGDPEDLIRKLSEKLDRIQTSE